jgi:hypothetical protein
MFDRTVTLDLASRVDVGTLAEKLVKLDRDRGLGKDAHDRADCLERIPGSSVDNRGEGFAGAEV